MDKMDKFKVFCEGLYSLAKATIVLIVIFAVVFNIRPLIETLRVLGSPVKAASEFQNLAIENLKIGNFEKSKELFEKSYELYPTERVKLTLENYEKTKGDSLTYSAADSILSTYGEKKDQPFNLLRQFKKDPEFLKKVIPLLPGPP